MSGKSNRILAVVDDLFFVVKISDTAKRSGIGCDFVKTQDDLIARASAELPALLIVDLNTRSLDAVALIEAFKGNETFRRVPVVSFVSHVDGETKRRAQAAGADMVLARSAFSANLPQICKRNASAA